MNKRNPRKTAVQWAQIIADLDQSGLSVANYCTQHGLVLTTFGKWKRKFSNHHVPVVGAPAFVPIQRTESATRTDSSVTLQIGPSITLSIRLDGPLESGNGRGIRKIRPLANALNRG